MSNFLYITKKGKQVGLNYLSSHKSLFDLVRYDSVGRWKVKKRLENKEDILYLMYKIQSYVVDNKVNTTLPRLKVSCLITYILLSGKYEHTFNDLIVHPYGFFFSSVQHLLKTSPYFDNNDSLELITKIDDCPLKEILDRRFDMLDKRVLELQVFDFVDYMHKTHAYKNYYNSVCKNGFYSYDIPSNAYQYFVMYDNLYNHSKL